MVLARGGHLALHSIQEALRERNTGSGVGPPGHEELHHAVPAIAPGGGVVAKFVGLAVNAEVLACGEYALISVTVAVLFSAS